METKNQVVKQAKTFEKINFNPINYKEKFGEKKQIFDFDYVMIQKAYDKLTEIYNSSEQQRKFVHHLIKAFLPLDMWHRLVSTGPEQLRCAILNYKVTGISNVADCYGKVGTQKMIADCKANLENRDTLTEEEVDKIQAVLKEYPIEVQKCRIGVRSDKSTKILMLESIVALQDLAEQLNFNIPSIIDVRIARSFEKIREQNKERREALQKPLAERVKINVETNYALSDKLDSKSLNALGAMKEYLEEKQIFDGE